MTADYDQWEPVHWEYGTRAPFKLGAGRGEGGETEEWMSFTNML